MIVNIIIGILAFALGAFVVWMAKESDVKVLKSRLESEIVRSQRVVEEAKDRERDLRDQLRQQSQDADRRWDLKIEALRQELMKVSAQQLSHSGQELRKANDASLQTLLRPLQQQFDAFRRAVDETRVQGEVSKKSIEDKFAQTMKMFQLQQENAILRLQDVTSKIGNDAVALAEALKTNTKRQGNWGEMVLQTMLENSGLQEGAHFFVQYNVDDHEGNRQIPDVVVKFPEGRSVIIDSKVSLTAYAQYFETDDETQRQELLKAHLRSVERHIAELSAKQYPRSVENAMDYVLMFIPNESSYVMAIKLNPDLLNQAYAKKVIVISPNNLMMALQIAYNMWQADKQVKNVEEIIHRAQLLYEKVSAFQSSFDTIGRSIKTLQDTYDTARKQAYTGSGNIMRQCEMLRDYGVPVKESKRLRLDDVEE